ncbi:uncharacterized protein LOC123702587 [Colias croceus]|uniref:uncharacterized protein LOC123702587 n=1 Tax=Colias crocea TaxID=72248 RepID=UPI001E281A26|nr:uncharacterized protein LOC123702587 [Colias croceus]
MTLIKAILRAQPKPEKKYYSPPPEVTGVKIIKKKKTKKHQAIGSTVDSSPPIYLANRIVRDLPGWVNNARDLYYENIKLVMAIKAAHFKGKIDSRWTRLPPPCKQYYEQRLYTYKRICRENKQLYKLIKSTPPRLETSSSLDKEWFNTKLRIMHMSRCEFILFPLKIEEVIEDPVFITPPGVKRPRVYITLKVRGAATMGTIAAELFTDVCPNTCKLFLDLLDGDGVGYGYVGTRFFRKVPNLYWSGGDVVHNNGFGCYAQKGRFQPIGAENYHFSHSMPGLKLSL